MAKKARANVKRVSLEIARWRLGAIWFTGSGILFLLVAVQSLFGVYEDKVQGVWGWALPNFLPTLMLMMGVFGGSALRDDTATDHMTVRKPFLTLASGLSVFHLLCLLMVLMVRPLVPALTDGAVATDPMALFEMSNLWLGPLQGLVGAAIGALFFTRTEDKAAASGRAAAGGVGSQDGAGVHKPG